MTVKNCTVAKCKLSTPCMVFVAVDFFFLCNKMVVVCCWGGGGGAVCFLLSYVLCYLTRVLNLLSFNDVAKVRLKSANTKKH